MATFFGIANLAKAATFSATSYETSLPPDNVGNDHGAASMGWQTVGGTTTATLTATFSSPGSTVRAVGIFRTNLTSVAQITIGLTYSGSSVYSTTINGGPSPGYGQVVHILASDTLADSLTLTIEDPSNTDDFLNVPLLFVGSLWQPTYRFGPASSYSRDYVTINSVSRGGQVFPTPLWDARTFSFAFEAIASDDVFAYMEEIRRLCSRGGNFLFIPDGDSVEINREALFGQIQQAGIVQWQQNLIDIRRWSSVIRERL